MASRAISHAARPSPQTKSEQIIVKSDGRHVFLDLDEIEWIEAIGKDLRLHLAGRVSSCASR